ncbi:YafY family transcriptional regulator [Paramixta manurensis]|uniref:YafY family transcriptional regulator n=1 Tax=Paramixta manurensis TaxID=2740817 RepID=A0A6M8UL43_9GAMM|nr:YafY family transcriptional regulator [Erwiniaceae bacterium PD-1]
MRRADRLFQLIQILRRSNRPVTAARLAEELEVSKRTVYRDIADLAGQRVPVEGTAGAGYTLSADYDMPPLMFTAEELEAIWLGVELVRQLPDATLANNASDVLTKILSALPAKLIGAVTESAVAVKPEPCSDNKPDTRPIRMAIRQGKKLLLHYHAASGELSSRIIWPVVLGYDQHHCLLIAWCESKGDFRHFRVDRIVRLAVLEEKITLPRRELQQKWRHWRKEMFSPVK